MWKELKDKKIGVWDTETDGLLHNVTQVHCGVLSVTTSHLLKETKEYCCAGWHKLFLQELDKLDVLAGHNLIGFDLPLLKQMYGWEPRSDVIILDTLFMSRLFNPDLEGGHSLGSWGERLGNAKIEYYPVSDPEQECYNPDEPVPKKNPCWEGSHYTDSMGSYCVQDVDLNVDVFWKLVELLKHFSWESIECEMKVATLIQRQMSHGFVFNKIEAEKLHARLVERVIELEDEVLTTFKPIAKFVREVQPKVKMDGTVSSIGLSQIVDWEEVIAVPEITRGTKEVVTPRQNEFTDETEYLTTRIKVVEYHTGSFSLIDWPEFSLGSRQQIAERLLTAGYKLTKKTEKGNYIIDDVVLKEAADAGVPEAKPLAEYFLIQKREAMVKDWLAKAIWSEKQGVWRIHGYVNSLGAATNRMTHSRPNVAQVPNSHSPYGPECRSLFTVRNGYKLVGCDASGLELRCLAHYMNDKEYTDAILNGDIHTKNQEAAGLPSRDNAKTFIYAFLYGAGDGKIGSIVGGNARVGKKLKEKFLSGTPALKHLREGILHAVSSRDWLKGVDGRILRIRSSHAALNTLLQGMGAIVMKYWLIEVARIADQEGLDWYPSANVHDEGQFEVADKDVDRFSSICEDAFPTVTTLLNINCPLEGEAKSGFTWAETH